MKISIVVPVYNEEKNLPELYERIEAAMLPLGYSWDVTFVDDGSRDNSLQVLNSLQAANSEKVRVVVFRRNHGQTAAISAGIDHSDGDIVILMDADLQNDPADIPLLLAKLDEGYDVVSGWRKDRQDNALTRNLPSHIANKLISSSTGVKLHDYGCTLKAYRREILDNVKLYGEMHRFIPVLAHSLGYKVAEIPVQHRAREFGKSKYGMERYLRGFFDLLTVKMITHYSKSPLYLFGRIGLFSSIVGSLITLYLAILKVFWGMPLSNRPLLFLGILLILGGLQFISLGLISELIVNRVSYGQRLPISIETVINPSLPSPPQE